MLIGGGSGEEKGAKRGATTSATPFVPPSPRLWKILAARGPVERLKGRSNSLFTSPSITKSGPSDIWEKIWVVPLPFLMLWAMPVRWGRLGSIRGGKFFEVALGIAPKVKNQRGDRGGEVVFSCHLSFQGPGVSAFA